MQVEELEKLMEQKALVGAVAPEAGLLPQITSTDTPSHEADESAQSERSDKSQDSRSVSRSPRNM